MMLFGVSRKSTPFILISLTRTLSPIFISSIFITTESGRSFGSAEILSLLVRPADADSTRSTLHGLRTADCGIAHTEVPPWHPDRRLDEAAKRWAGGAHLNEAVERSGYTATALSGLHLYGLDAPERPPLNASTCRILRDRSLKDIGAFRQRGELWVLFASRAVLGLRQIRS